MDHLSKLWNDEQLLKNELHSALNKLDSLIERDENNDILTGVAGTAVILINLFKRYKEEQILNLITKCGNRLIQNINVMEKGLDGKSRQTQRQPPGFAHGASGIIWALYEIYAITEQTVFKKVAEKALEFERTLFIPEKTIGQILNLKTDSFEMIILLLGVMAQQA